MKKIVILMEARAGGRKKNPLELVKLKNFQLFVFCFVFQLDIREECLMVKCLHRHACGQVCGGVFLIDGWHGCHLWAGGLRKQTKQAMKSKPVGGGPPWPLLPFLP